MKLIKILFLTNNPNFVLLFILGKVLNKLKIVNIISFGVFQQRTWNLCNLLVDNGYIGSQLAFVAAVAGTTRPSGVQRLQSWRAPTESPRRVVIRQLAFTSSGSAVLLCIVWNRTRGRAHMTQILIEFTWNNRSERKTIVQNDFKLMK